MGLALALAFVPQIAAAQAVGGDLVLLNNGGRLRGVVSEYEPGVRVVIQLPDGTSRTVVAADIASVTFADAQPAQQAPVVASTVTPPVTPPVTPTVPADAQTSVLSSSIPEPVAAPPTPTAPTVERWTAPRVFTSERLPEWHNAALEHAERLPHGTPHFGLQLEAGGQGVAGSNVLAMQGVGTLVAFGDFTIGSFGVVRLGAYGSFAAEGQWRSTWSRVAGFGARLQGGADIGSAFVRVGVDVGGAVAHGVFGVEGQFRVEFGGRLLDARTLELGVGLGVGVTPLGYLDGGFPIENLLGYGAMIPRLDAFLGWVFE